jgi:brefeldin A-resistance guanine nucleotide exchange factor 1
VSRRPLGSVPLALVLTKHERNRSMTEWNLIFALFSATIQQEEAAKISFELMRQLAAGKKEDKAKLGPNNYAPFLQLLVAFANVTVTAPNSAERAA